MDVIQQMIHGAGEVLAKLLLRREEAHELIVEQAATSKETGILIWSLLAAQDYNEAEKVLLKELRDNFDFDLYDIGVEFFNALDKLSDEELVAHGYSKERIDEGFERQFAVLKDKCGLKTN